MGSLWVAKHPTYLNPEGRLEALQLNWQDYADTAGVERHHAKPTITGFGLGYIMARSQIVPATSMLHSWKHIHNAPLQVLMELGVIGFGLLLWSLCAYWKRFWQVRQQPLATICAGIFLLFSFSSLFHFVDHLWVTAAMGLIGYCGVYVLGAEQVT